MSKKSKWLALVKLLAPIIITSIKPQLGPIVSEVTDAITEAEEFIDAKGPAKLGHVKNIAEKAADLVNATTGKEIVDKVDLGSAIDSTVETVVKVANLINNK